MKNPYTDTSKQEALYKDYILPRENELLRVLQEVRSDVDEVYLEKQHSSPKLLQHPGIQDIHKYPHGYCYEITTKVKEGLTEIMPDFFQEFLKAGGLFERNWGIFVESDGNRVFQNAIQIGTRIYDVCHEEPSGTDEQLHIAHISDPRYKLIDCYQDYAEVQEEYHHFEAYSTEGLINIAFAPIVPLIFIAADGRLVIGDEQVIVKRNVHTHFRFGKDFLKDGVERYPVLPELIKKNFQYCFEQNIRYVEGDKKKFVEGYGLKSMLNGRLGFSHAHLRAGMKKWHAFDNRFRKHGADEYYGARLTITLLRRVLSTYNAFLMKGKLPFLKDTLYDVF